MHRFCRYYQKGPKALLKSATPLLAILLLFTDSLAAESKTTSKPCPYDCSSAGGTDSNCSDYRVGDLCYVTKEVEQQSGNTKNSGSRICVQAESGRIRVRNRCLTDQGETEASISSLSGEKGEQGEKGATGAPGATGADGTIKIYGDGSSGDVAVSVSEVYGGSSEQYGNFTIAQGATLTVPSGSIIRCNGSFENNGNIVILPAQRQHPKVSENGRQASGSAGGGAEALGGEGGSAVSEGLARSIIRTGLLGGGDGYKTDTEDGSSGGGSLLILCKTAVINGLSGVITADGLDGAEESRGGGAGGIIVLASQELVLNRGALRARGGDGSVFLANNGSNTGFGPGGGGGGGIVHLIAPTSSSSGSVDVSGGNGGPAAGAGSITAIFYSGGGGGGASGGDGGDGGIVNPGNIGNASVAAGGNGTNGKFFITEADPTSLY